MNIEEAVKIIKELIDGVKEYGYDYTVEEAVVINKSEYTAIETLLTAYEKEKEKNKELEKENKKLNLIRLQYLVSSFPDTTETYKKYRKELDELLKEE